MNYDKMKLWQLSLMINEKARKIVEDKFTEKLKDYCKVEQIKIIICEDEEDLNKQFETDDAAGIYRHIRAYTRNDIKITEKYPQIGLPRDFSVYTFAHEVGHHISVKTFFDKTEYMADACIQLLAEQMLSNVERAIIHTYLSIHSHQEFPFPKIKISEWEQFKKEHNL